MAKNYISPGGFKKLQDEYNFLKKEERPRITRLVAWAASLGDRSENADYLYGKKRLREIDRRMRFLSKRINEAEVVDPQKITSNKVQFGATVTLDDGSGLKRIVSIVGVDETDARQGRVSWQSPLGSALLGKEVGDEIEVRAPGGVTEYEIVAFKYNEILIEEFQYDGPGES
ncbi:MAG: transcription elongation factor GreB [Bacteriovoracaceae bacterium]|nr:transcription elongation factor GreB [Bacteriovoracaceae bacterium]